MPSLTLSLHASLAELHKFSSLLTSLFVFFHNQMIYANYVDRYLHVLLVASNKKPTLRLAMACLKIVSETDMQAGPQCVLTDSSTEF